MRVFAGGEQVFVDRRCSRTRTFVIPVGMKHGGDDRELSVGQTVGKDLDVVEVLQRPGLGAVIGEIERVCDAMRKARLDGSAVISLRAKASALVRRDVVSELSIKPTASADPASGAGADLNFA